MNSLYMLTDMTGAKSQEDRTAVFMRWEVRRKSMVLTFAGIILGLIPQLFLFIVVGGWGLLLVPIMIALVFFIFEARQRTGLQLRQWEVIRDRLNDVHQGKIILCGLPLESTSKWYHIRSSSRPVQDFDTTSTAQQSADSYDIFDMVEGTVTA